MNKTLLILLLIPTLGFGQDTLIGIGPLKIGITTSTFVKSVSNKYHIPIIASYDGMQTMENISYKQHKTSKIYKLGKNKKPVQYILEDFYYIDLPSISIYFIDFFSVSGIDLEKLYLFFKHDTLYKLQCEGDYRIEEALNLKYGKGEGVLHETKEKCYLPTTKLEIELPGYFIITKWQSLLDRVEAQSTSHKGFNSDCKAIFDYIFYLRDIGIDEMTKEEIKIHEAEVREKETQEKLKKLKDF